MFRSVDGLRNYGFEGLVSIREMKECKLQCVPGERGDIGVYAVLRVKKGVPIFLKRAPADISRDATRMSMPPSLLRIGENVRPLFISVRRGNLAKKLHYALGLSNFFHTARAMLSAIGEVG